jgi:hypothetical protein
MRRIFALMLIAASGWLLYRTSNQWLGGMGNLLSHQAMALLDEPKFTFPAVGSALGLLGGLTIFFGGPGGAVLALLGGVGIAGFAVNLDGELDLSHFWNNELAVGVVILMLAAMTASTARVRPPSMGDTDDDKNSHASGRRAY